MNDKKIEAGIIKAMLTWRKEPAKRVNIFLPSIFLSFECFLHKLVWLRLVRVGFTYTTKVRKKF
jgi:hypothetical protein